MEDARCPQRRQAASQRRERRGARISDRARYRTGDATSTARPSLSIAPRGTKVPTEHGLREPQASSIGARTSTAVVAAWVMDGISPGEGGCACFRPVQCPRMDEACVQCMCLPLRWAMKDRQTGKPSRVFPARWRRMLLGWCLRPVGRSFQARSLLDGTGMREWKVPSEAPASPSASRPASQPASGQACSMGRPGEGAML